MGTKKKATKSKEGRKRAKKKTPAVEINWNELFGGKSLRACPVKLVEGPEVYERREAQQTNERLKQQYTTMVYACSDFLRTKVLKYLDGHP